MGSSIVDWWEWPWTATCPVHYGWWSFPTYFAKGTTTAFFLFSPVG